MRSNDSRRKKWQKELIERISIKEILAKRNQLLPLKKLKQKDLTRIDELFPIRITPHYASLINWNDPHDPLLRMVFPDIRELHTAGLADQSGERMNVAKTGVPGLQHKYSATALLFVTTACASYCRFCFRKRRGASADEVVRNLDAALLYIERHKEITNVLLSGGDSFMLGNAAIERILRRLRKIKHVGIIRFGSKMPVFLPSRFEDPELMEILKKYSRPEKKIYLVSHVNHPNELDKHGTQAHRTLIEAGIPIRSQTVLMKGVNDDTKTLSELLKRLASMGVTPYYVFQCRPVKRGTHFALPLLKGFRIFEQAKKPLSGLAKSCRFIMSHTSGKIEIVSVERKNGERIAVLKQHQCRDPKYLGRLMALAYGKPAYWLDDILKQKHRVILGEDVVKYAKSQIKLLERHSK